MTSTLTTWIDSADDDRDETPADVFSVFRGDDEPMPNAHKRSGDFTLSAEPNLIRLDQVRTRKVRWLWRDRIPMAKYSMLAGDPGCGKSLITMDIAARVSSGNPWPDGSSNVAGGVVLMSAEDDIEDTIVPRLIAAGADLSKITALQSVSYRDDQNPDSGRERSVNLLTDLDVIEQAVKRTPDCRLLIVDPISAYGGSLDSHKNADVRGMLAPLCAMAAEHEFAILGVTHLNKSNGTSALYRATGSLAYVAAARAVWLVTKDREDPTGGRRLMLPAKCNLSPDTAGLAYCITKQQWGDLPVIAWDDRPVHTTADSALEAPRQSHKPSRTDEAASWLIDRLSGAGSVPSETVDAEAREAGFSGGTLARARRAAGVVSVKLADGKWYVSLES